ncbi:MAG: hypothetical protein MJ198_01620 [Bacteroidales bacterium]|nr:hypothetical protein [Bacteroidales bacterium]
MIQRGVLMPLFFMKLKYYFILFFITACSRNYPEYDKVPSVEFHSAMISQDSSDKKVKFSFMLYDGDGNFGLDNADTTAPFIDTFQQNFYATPFYLENGTFNQLPYTLSYRIPRLSKGEQEKSLKAKVSIDFAFSKTAFPYDTIFFTYFVYDRALNKSNVDTSWIIAF